MWRALTGSAGGPSKAKKVKTVVQVWGGNSSMLPRDSFRNERLTHPFARSAALSSQLPARIVSAKESLSRGLPESIDEPTWGCKGPVPLP